MTAVSTSSVSQSSVHGEPARYRFGPLERRGLIAGWRSGQVACVASSLVVAVGALRVDPHSAGVVAACAAVGAGGFCATWPLAGSTVEQWIPVLARWGAAGRRRRTSTRPFGGHSSVASDGRVSEPGEFGDSAATAPGALRGIHILDFEAGDIGSIGVLADDRRGRYAAVLAVSADGFTLLEPAERDRRVASWSSVLAGLARERSALDRVQWVVRSLPSPPAGMPPRVPNGSTYAEAAAASYAQLLEGEAAGSMRYETFVVVRLEARRRRGIGGPVAACDALAREVASLCPELSTAGIRVDGVLGRDAVECVLAEAFRAEGIADPRFADGSLRTPGGPWPMGARAEWATYATDDAWHATYWIAEWPRLDVHADFLTPLLIGADRRVTVAVTMEPLDALRATRRVENARVARAADDELRRRGGFSVTARRRREEEALGGREAELADGHAQFRFSGYVGVTASSQEDLDAACGSVEQAAARCFLSLRRLYGDQERAFAALLPCAEGLS